MTIRRPLYIIYIAATLLFFAFPSIGFSQQRIARTVSPSMVIRVLGFQNVTPEDLHNLQRLYESTGWKILKMDDDPSDGEMAVWGGRNMELSMDEFAISGTDKPNNGIYIHLTKTDGFKVDHIRIVFNDENEKQLFANMLPRYGILASGDDEFSGEVKLGNGQSVDVECDFDYEGMNPKVEIDIRR